MFQAITEVILNSCSHCISLHRILLLKVTLQTASIYVQKSYMKASYLLKKTLFINLFEEDYFLLKTKSSKPEQKRINFLDIFYIAHG